MNEFTHPIHLELSGLGIIMYSPPHAKHIKRGENYFSAHYNSEIEVQKHIQAGTIVGFGTGSPGSFQLRFFHGYPKESEVQSSDWKLRLAIQCVEGRICFRDLYDLMNWSSDCPTTQTLEIADGIYHITLLSNTPVSGVIGDDQTIDCYLQKLAVFPELASGGIPSLI